MAQTANSGAGSVGDTWRKRGRADAPVLPDDLVWEIFYRQPVKAILRCRAACRSWHRLSCNDEFLLAPHRRQPSLSLLSFRSRVIGHTTDASVDAFDLRLTPAVRRPVLPFNDYNNRRDFSIHGSCNGLLLLSLANGRFYLCNPTTLQWLAIPDLTGANVASLYPHRPSGEYRVLCWKHPNKNNSDTAVYYVLTVGSSEGHRCVGLPVASPSMESDTNHWLIRASDHPPALLHDCLHWHVNSKVVVFDTEAESFKWMQSPVAADSAHLLQMDDGTLRIGHVDGDTKIAQVWVLQDYEAEVWSSKFRKKLPASTSSGSKVVSESAFVLVSVCYHDWCSLDPGTSSSLFQRDDKGRFVSAFRREH